MEFRALHLGDILPVEEDLTFRRIIKPYQETHEGTFATAGLADEAQGLSFIEFQVNIIAGGKHTSVVGGKAARHMARVNQQVFFIKHSVYLPDSVPHPTAAWYMDWWTGGAHSRGRPGRRPRRAS